MKILVTGAIGNLGSKMIENLLAKSSTEKIIMSTFGDFETIMSQHNNAVEAAKAAKYKHKKCPNRLYS